MSTAIAPVTLAAIYRQACRLDVEAFKPGNVSCGAPAYGLEAGDFVASGLASVEPLIDESLSLGQRIEQAVACTQAQVATNTNLGIVLLCAPILMAAQCYPNLALRDAVQKVLAQTTVEDTAAVFSAIRMANPAGMGNVETHDLNALPQASLITVMASAAERDLIARQYANGFDELLNELVPQLTLLMDLGQPAEIAISEVFLWWLARYPDSHIQRKHGLHAAQQVSEQAAQCLQLCRASTERKSLHRELRQLDKRLKQARLNPGTSADFCVAAFVSYRLLRQADLCTGNTPDFCSEAKPMSAMRSLFSSSQSFQGEMQWQ